MRGTSTTLINTIRQRVQTTRQRGRNPTSAQLNTMAEGIRAEAAGRGRSALRHRQPNERNQLDSNTEGQDDGTKQPASNSEARQNPEEPV